MSCLNINTTRQKTRRSEEFESCAWKVSIVSPWNAWLQLWNKNRCGVYCIPKSLKDKANKQDCWHGKAGKSQRKPEGDKLNTNYLHLLRFGKWVDVLIHQRLIRLPTQVPKNIPQHLWRKYNTSLHSEQPVLISQHYPIPTWRRRFWIPQMSKYVRNRMTRL